MMMTDGDTQASPVFDDVVRAERSRLEAVAWALLGDRHLAEDVAQESLAKAYRRWDDVKRLESPGGWLHRVTVNDALSRRRRMTTERRALGRVHAGGEADADQGERTAEALRVWAAVRALPRDQATAIALRYFADLEVAEIALVTGRAVGTVKSDLYRGRERLRDRLLDEEAS
ncbi:MAG: sigma-70 family RNA polymerase sigma factor [Acidimicrobiia bacterium]|nr:sigma-70 family RNA polymerase sigma factor [Acidimicrobiia bacterium]